MEKQHPIGELITTTMQKIREIADVNTIVGQPIHAEGVTIIPISKLSIGFASGGSDFATKNQKPESDNAFGGGGGAGVNLTPVAFLVVKGDTVKLMPVAPAPGSTVDRVVEMVPEVIDKITGFIEKQDKDNQNASTHQTQEEDKTGW
ncbi:GerW family sporulation protein [Flavonifractor hominis]|uniref:GerW family sporulation protein n=1 Tax=Flavonifractor hominis TaxID=3133178 RepID=A0ABV1EKS7_9FIRM